MSSILSALDAVIDRHGRPTATDPVALAAALRAGTDPPADADVAALADAAGSGVVARMRELVDRGDGPDAALTGALRAAYPDADPVTPSPRRWAAAALGAALGLLPRGSAIDAGRPSDALLEDTGPDATRTDSAPPTAARRSRRWPLAVAAGVVVVLGAAALVLVQPTSADPPAPAAAPTAAPAPVTPVPSPAPAATPTPADEGSTFLDDAPADPRDAFVDPALLAMAEPYVSLPGVRCAPEPDLPPNLSEYVTCDLGRGWLGFFTTMYAPELVEDIRDGYIAAEGPQPVDGTVRSLRWKSVPGRPGVKTGIRPGSDERGEGTRVRFLDPEGFKWLYFDHDGARQYALLATPLPEYDLDDLRAYWADPSSRDR